ncbi:MAG: BolA/IbaG family iron-sulfur metabolism protein [Gammaproteobacteria bacterium]|nr:BolA/IbaG family iron-sulfur metabolism protein [Gammaproteobacteria bacterium]
MNTQQRISEKLRNGLQPSHLDVINESHMHNVPPGSESHFKVVVVADAFDGKLPLARHRLVNALLREELDGGVHALALHTMTDAEWQKKQGNVADSPPCLGGSKAGG